MFKASGFKSIVLCWLAPVWLVLVASTKAEGRCGADDPQCTQVGAWNVSVGLGLGGRSNPVVGNDDVPIVVLPSIRYYGERFFWETDVIGYTLLETRHHMVNVMGTVTYDQTFFNEWGVGNFAVSGGSGGGRVSSTAQLRGLSGNAGNDEDPNFSSGGPVLATPVPNQPNLDITGPDREEEQGAIDLDRLHDRDISGLAGFEYVINVDRVNLSLQALQDITGVHDGQQVRAALSTGFAWSRQGAEFSLGAEWRDARMNDYYYGVRESEVDDPLHAHRLQDDVSFFSRIDWRYQLGRRWDLRGIVHHRIFGDEVKNSPLITDDSTTAIFIGGVYHF